MKKTITLIILILTSITIVHSQQNSQFRGKVLFISSGKKPAKGVKVQGRIKGKKEFTTPVYTTSSGSFELNFPFKRDGYLIELKIGYKTGDGQQIEVVNDMALKECRMSNRASEIFEVIVAEKGQRDYVARHYYNIIKTSADRELENKRKEFSALLKSTERDYKKIEDLSRQLQRLQEQSDSMTIYREAYRIASINKDNASKRVLKYIQLLDEGKSIQIARQALSISGAGRDLRRSSKAFIDAKEELDTCSSAAIQVGDIPQAIDCYEIIIEKLEKMNIDPVIIADYYVETSALYIETEDLEQAKSYLKKALELGYTKVIRIEQDIWFDKIIDDEIRIKIQEIKNRPVRP